MVSSIRAFASSRSGGGARRERFPRRSQQSREHSALARAAKPHPGPEPAERAAPEAREGFRVVVVFALVRLGVVLVVEAGDARGVGLAEEGLEMLRGLLEAIGARGGEGGLRVEAVHEARHVAGRCADVRDGICRVRASARAAPFRRPAALTSGGFLIPR